MIEPSEMRNHPAEPVAGNTGGPLFDPYPPQTEAERAGLSRELKLGRAFVFLRERIRDPQERARYPWETSADVLVGNPASAEDLKAIANQVATETDAVFNAVREGVRCDPAWERWRMHLKQLDAAKIELLQVEAKSRSAAEEIDKLLTVGKDVHKAERAAREEEWSLQAVQRRNATLERLVVAAETEAKRRLAELLSAKRDELLTAAREAHRAAGDKLAQAVAKLVADYYSTGAAVEVLSPPDRFQGPGIDRVERFATLPAE